MPQTIANRRDYIACLSGFLRLYRPLEARLDRWAAWSEIGLDLRRRSHVSRLIADLEDMGVSGEALPDAPPDMLPDLPGFAHGLGALYVLEGSTLGGRIILRHLEQSGIVAPARACAYFGGHGSQSGPQWNAFRQALERYGDTHADQEAAVVLGAERTFEAVAGWMRADRWKGA